jgi:nucleotide-binding universal stress UspA family protein
MKQDPTIAKILVGIDEEDAADHAVRAGFALAEALDAKIELLHAARMEVPRWVGNILGPLPGLSEQLRSAARASRTRHLSRVLEDTPHGALEELLTVVQERPAKAILAHANTHNADLIVLGGHRDAGLFRFGSTARTVLGRSKCPVWVQAEPVRKIGTILVAIDMSLNSEIALRMGALLASKLGAKVVVFHSFVPPYFSYDDPPVDLGLGPTYGFEEFQKAEQAHFEKTVAGFDWGDVKFSTTFSEGNPAQRILRIQDSVDLIVMGTHGRTGLARAILGSQAYAVIKEAHRPVLAIPNPEHEYPETG